MGVRFRAVIDREQQSVCLSTREAEIARADKKAIAHLANGRVDDFEAKLGGKMGVQIADETAIGALEQAPFLALEAVPFLRHLATVNTRDSRRCPDQGSRKRARRGFPSRASCWAWDAPREGWEASIGSLCGTTCAGSSAAAREA